MTKLRHADENRANYIDIHEPKLLPLIDDVLETMLVNGMAEYSFYFFSYKNLTLDIAVKYLKSNGYNAWFRYLDEPGSNQENIAFTISIC